MADISDNIESTIEEIDAALSANKCVTVKGDFHQLYALGYVQRDVDHESDGRFEVIFDKINENHSSLTEFNYSFYKIIGNEVVELYFKECSTHYGSSYKERKNKEYLLTFKGHYYLDTLELVPSKKPSIFAYNWYGQPTLMVTVRGPETEWYITSYASSADYFGKFFDSDLYFGLSRVDYDPEKKTITDVYFKVGEKLITAVELAEFIPAFKDCSYLKLLNWKKYVTPDHITLLDMSLI